MSECGNTELRDLLPDLAADRLGGADRARVAAHVATCAACAAEVELLRVARRVASRGVPVIDVARVVAALPRPVSMADRKPVLLTSPSRPAVSRVGDRDARALPSRGNGDWSGWRIAAAATIVVGSLSVAVLRTHGGSGPASVASGPVALPGLAVAPEAPPVTPAATSLAPGTSGPAGGAPGSVRPEAASPAGPGLAVAGDISELSDGDVETLLQDMNGLDAEPSVDPDAAAPGLPALVSP